MSTVRLSADSGGGTVAIAGPSTTASNAALELTLPSSGTGAKIISSKYPSSIQVLEQFYSPCDGSVIALANGNLTLPTVSGVAELTTSLADLAFSSISYNPPTGTTQVIYECQFYMTSGDATPLIHFIFNVDGTDVTNSSWTHMVTNNQRDTSLISFRWGINIGGSTTAATGRLASWSSAKTIKLRGREYSSGNEGVIHEVYHWDGSTNQQRFHQPCIGITAIGAAS